MLRQLAFVGLIVVGTLAVGVAGYMCFPDMDFVDSLLEASMFLSGAGPLYTERSSPTGFKLFSSMYALFSTLVVVTLIAVVSAPVIHRILHRIHLEDRGDS
jgi:hypothetical protein